MRKLTIALCSLLLVTGCQGMGETLPAKPPEPGKTKPVEKLPTEEPNTEQPASGQTTPPASQPDTPASAPATHYIVNEQNFMIKNADNPTEKIVLLTFDDGPTGEATIPILDILDKHKAKSIWFVNGHQLANKQPDGSYKMILEKAELLKEIHKRGHIIGNHTWWHENLRQLSEEKQREEILSVNKVVEEIIGEEVKYFRPPFGAYTDLSKQICVEEGMQSMNWSVGSLDWEPKTYMKPGKVTEQVMETVHTGGNILFHDRVWTSRELDTILTNLENEGYTFVLPTEGRESTSN